MFLVVWLLVLVTWLLPGVLLVQLGLPRRGQWPLVAWAAAGALGAGVLGAVHFASFLVATTATIGTVNVALYAAVVLALALLSWRRGTWRAWPRLTPWPALFAALTLFLVLLLVLLPSYRPAYRVDWAMYVPNAAVYLLRVPAESFGDQPAAMEYLARRTPLFSLILSFYGSLVPTTFGHFQVVGTVANALVWWNLAWLAHALGGRAAGRRALWLLPVTPLLVHAIAIPVPKLLATALLLTAGQFAWRWLRPGRHPHGRDAAAFALCAVLAYLAHPSMLLYAGWLFAACAWAAWRRRQARLVAPWGWGAAASAVLWAPWFAWVVGTFGWRAALTPSSTVTAATTTTLGAYLKAQGAMLLTTALVPDPVIYVWRLVRRPAADLDDWLARWADPGLRGYFETFAGGLTLCGTAALLLALAWGGPRLPWRRLWPLPAVLALGALACLAVHVTVDLKGHAANIMAPLFVLVFAAFATLAGRLPAWGWAALVAGMTVETLAVQVVVYRVGLAQRGAYVTLFDTWQPVLHGWGVAAALAAGALVGYWCLLALWLPASARHPVPGSPPCSARLP